MAGNASDDGMETFDIHSGWPLVQRVIPKDMGMELGLENAVSQGDYSRAARELCVVSR